MELAGAGAGVGEETGWADQRYTLPITQDEGLPESSRTAWLTIL